MPVIQESWLRKNSLEPARWASEGQTLYVPLHIGGGAYRLVAAKVAVAAGHSARMVNESRGIDQWYSVWDIYRKAAPEK